MSQQQKLEIPEEVKLQYFQIKSSTVQEMKDLLGSMRNTKEQDLQARVKELEEELQHLRNSKKYGLVWDSEREPEQVVVDCQTKLPILKEIKERKILSDNSGDSNLLIEGDNYHALQVLSYTHKEAIDVIYIDPPYNTKNNDFIYNDKIIDLEDSYRHSKWLNFMEKRITLAYDLLSDDGVIFISIDDNEKAQLKLLCDSIFNELNFLGTIAWESKTKSQNTKSSFNKLQPKIEYILLYTKKNKRRFNLENLGEKEYPLKDESGEYRLHKLEPMNASGLRGRNSMIFEILGISPPEGKQWQVGKETIDDFLSREDIIIKEGGLYLKMRPFDERNEITNPFWGFFSKEIGTAESAKKELSEFLGNDSHGFETVKPLKLIKQLLFHSSKTDSKILDFFAGSGTTGHAVLELNKDGGNRKFILCTNNENKICEEIAYKRVERITSGYIGAKGKEIAGLGGNLRYYKTAFVEVENLKEVTDEKKLELTYNAGELLAIKEGIYNERLKTSYGQVFENTQDIVAVYFKESTRELAGMAEELAKIQQEKGGKVIWYIYGNPFQLEAFPMIENLELKDIPDPILKVYREINKV